MHSSSLQNYWSGGHERNKDFLRCSEKLLGSRWRMKYGLCEVWLVGFGKCTRSVSVCLSSLPYVSCIYWKTNMALFWSILAMLTGQFCCWSFWPLSRISWTGFCCDCQLVSQTEHISSLFTLLCPPQYRQGCLSQFALLESVNRLVENPSVQTKSCPQKH